MRVIFNQCSTVGNKSGVGHCAHQLLSHLRQVPQAAVTAFPSDRWLRWDGRFKSMYQSLRTLKAKWKPRRSHPSLAMFGLVGWAENRIRQRYNQWLAARHRELFFGDRFDIYHEPNFIPVDSSLKTVTTLHDLSVLLHPEWHPADRVRWYEQGFPKTLERSAHFIAVSDFTRRQVQRYLGVPANKVTCVHNAARPEFVPLPGAIVSEALRRHGLPPRYLLHVGTIEPRKNILRLMQAYCSLPDELRRDWPLLLVGQWGWKVQREQAFYHDEARHRGVRHVGYLPDELLPFLYNGARALVYPSVYEGFGLPPLEMLATGGAVLGSAIEAVIEVIGDQGHIVAPENTDGWRQAMQQVIVDDDWWRQLRQGAEAAARRFSWQSAAAQTVEVYRKVLRKEAPRAVPLPSAA